jgi:hypothetical protein
MYSSHLLHLSSIFLVEETLRLPFLTRLLVGKQRRLQVAGPKNGAGMGIGGGVLRMGE